MSMLRCIQPIKANPAKAGDAKSPAYRAPSPHGSGTAGSEAAPAPSSMAWPCPVLKKPRTSAMQTTATAQIVFLQGAWRALLQDQPEPFHKGLLSEFVSNEVLARLPERTTLKHVLQECHAHEAVQECYIKSFLGLRRVWDKLTPESRHIIIEHGNKCGVHKQGGLRLQALQDDEAALTIRWHVAQRLYEKARDEAFAACSAFGLEMAQPRGLPRANEFAQLVQNGQEILLKLLRERVNTDKTAVTMAVGYVTPV